MVHYKYRYFDVQALGEHIRQIFVLAGVEFEDERIKMSDWPQYTDRVMFGQLPVLFVDGEALAQSSAIARYLARKFDLAGHGDWEEAQVDAISDQFKDFLVEVRTYNGAKIKEMDNEEKLRNEIFLPALKKHMPFLVDFLKKTGSGFLVGQSVTWVDLLVAEFVNTFNSFDESAGYFEEYPEVMAHRDKIHSIPQIKKWRAERPPSSMKYM